MRLFQDIGELPGAVKVLRTAVFLWRSFTASAGAAKKIEQETAGERLKYETIMKKLLLIIALLGVLGFSSKPMPECVSG